MEYKRKRSRVNMGVLYSEAGELLRINGEICTAMIAEKLFVSEENAAKVFDLMAEEEVIRVEGGKGFPIDKADEPTVKIKGERYGVSNSWNKLFVCENESDRKKAVSSVMNQLKGKNVNSLLLSAEPSIYGEIADAKGFNTARAKKILKMMDDRYDIIAGNRRRNYIDYNTKNKGSEIPLFVLVVDGIDKVMADSKYNNLVMALSCIALKGRAAGIHVIAFVDEKDEENNVFYSQFQNPLNLV